MPGDSLLKNQCDANGLTSLVVRQSAWISMTFRRTASLIYLLVELSYSVVLAFFLRRLVCDCATASFNSGVISKGAFSA
ncbi:hypothetical protein, partial [Mesorhizobium sp. M1C.F.Ca.ET.212.01.1.1]|uniref:hypothetical protein n=1 Tax=Mesorhizobium sp. M1C.F.Ca.ET.212.01.1.1 TaxID=2500527 RepID=UPI001AEEA80B